MDLINERTARSLNIALRGDDGSLITPSTLKYRVDCETNGQSVTDWTDLTPESITTIEIPATTNAIIDDARPYEDKRVTVMADEGLSSQSVQTIVYRVRNLQGVP